MKSTYFLKITIKFCISALFIFQFPSVFSQNYISEYGRFECSQSKLIKLPLSDNQTTFYEHRDQFSFWYRIEATNDSIITCEINPLNESDEYSLYVYQYNKFDFCNKVFYNNIQPHKFNEFKIFKYDLKSNKTTASFQARKGDAFYLCVLNVSESNCGHHLTLTNQGDTFNIDAIHIPCMTTDDFEVNFEHTPIINSKTSVDLITINVSLIDEYQPSKNIDAKLNIIDELTGSTINLDFNAKNGFVLKIEKGKAYKVECIALGYKRFDHSIIISEYLNDTLGFEVFLRPLKSGDTFIMTSIYFYPNTYALKSKSKKEIDYLLNFLINNPEVKIEIAGHTNENNRIKKNRAYKDKGLEWNFEGSSKKLSIYRADTIKKQLIEKGIEISRIETKGYGGEKMIIKAAKTLEDIEKNVRVEIQIL